MAAEVTKLLYVVVVDGEEGCEETGDGELRVNEKDAFRYTRSVLQSTLQLMGCKPRHAFKISKRVFEKIRSECTDVISVSACTDILEQHNLNAYHHEESDVSMRKSFELYKKRTTVVVRRKTFLDVVSDALTEYKYVGPHQRADLTIACRIRERKESVTLLLCGTSGCGKSTLSALLGSRLGITTVISTDSIRHMRRSFVTEKENPLLWSSTYHAGEHLDPLAVAEAKAKRRAKKLDGYSIQALQKDATIATNSISPKQMAIEGFKAQSEMVIDSLDRLITVWEDNKESVIVEGVHLSLNFVMGLMKKHPSIIPFMIYIANEEKHLERFAVRAKHMTLDPAKNKYVKYIRNIRTIQEYLCSCADKHLVPKVNNTNVDRSVASIHATAFSCLRRREAGDKLYDPSTNTVAVIDEEYMNHRAANSLSSKGVLKLLQRNGSSKHLMALLNNDGSVAKAWPIYSSDTNDKLLIDHYVKSGEIGSPIYGPLHVQNAEPVNLQFGYFGISDWLNDTGCSSRANSVDGSRGELTDNGSRYHSSSCSSPRFCEGPSKELREEQFVNGSDEEIDELPEIDSDEDSNEDLKHIHEELEGSVDEESTKSDEEYDDLAMQDGQQIAECGYCSDKNDEESKRFGSRDKIVPVSGDGEGHAANFDGIYQQKTNGLFSGSSECKSFFEEPSLLHCSPLSPLREKNELMPSPNFSNGITGKRCHAMSSLENHL
ncbi:unnamed protein product [Cuscuta campestris]|nr:unnamed protein product [Cuscuta campestris]